VESSSIGARPGREISAGGRVGLPSVALLARRHQLWVEVQDLTATLHRFLRTRPGDAAPE